MLASKADATTTHHFYTEDPQAYMHILLYYDIDPTVEPVPPYTVSRPRDYSGVFYLGDGHFNLTIDEANRRYYFDLLFTKPADTNPIYPYIPELFTTSVATSADNLLPSEFGYGYDPGTEIISISEGPSLEFDSFNFPELGLEIQLPSGSSNSKGYGGKLQFVAWASLGAIEIPGTSIMEIYISVPSLVYDENATNIPEPTTQILLLTGLVGLIKSRLRHPQARN